MVQSAVRQRQGYNSNEGTGGVGPGGFSGGGIAQVRLSRTLCVVWLTRHDAIVCLCVTGPFLLSSSYPLSLYFCVLFSRDFSVHVFTFHVMLLLLYLSFVYFS